MSEKQMSNFKIGFIGAGKMGAPMCTNIIKKGNYPVWVYRGRVDEIAALGGIKCNSLEEITKNCNVIISVVPGNNEVKEVVDGLLPYIKKGTIYIDMSTISPDTSKKLAEKVKSAGCVMMDIPVVKSEGAAIAGNLGIYVGGDHKTYEKIRPILECMGKPEEIIYYGTNGSGLAMKMCHNMLVGIIQNGVNEMLVMAKAAGIDYDKIGPGIRAGGGQNFYLDAKAESIKTQDFTPRFSFKNMHKDMHLIIKFANSLGLNLVGAKRVLKIYDSGIEELGSEDFSATIKILEKMVKK